MLEWATECIRSKDMCLDFSSRFNIFTKALESFSSELGLVNGFHEGFSPTILYMIEVRIRVELKS